MTAPTLKMVNPATLVIGTNVRADAVLDAAFVESVATYGVMQPITVISDNDGNLTVRMGQRRTLAAVTAGLAEVPVLVVTENDADDADRIIRQLGENDHRSGVSDTDRTSAYAQLALIGLSADQIAKRTGRARAEVEAAQAVIASKGATEALQTAQLSLEDAALVAEFDRDKDAQRRVIEAAQRGTAAHEASRIRQDKAAAACKTQLLARLKRAKVPLADAPGTWVNHGMSKSKHLNELHWSKKERIEIDSKRHAAECPGHAAYLANNYAAARRGADAWEVRYICTQPDLHVRKPNPYAPERTPMSDAEKAERKELITNNRAWDAAEPVRRQWLADFARGTQAPKGAEAFIATALVHGWTPESYDVRTEAAKRLTPSTTARAALRVAVSVLLNGWDAKTSRNTWRNPSEQDAAMIEAMTSWGYKPSDVEALVVSRWKATKTRTKRRTTVTVPEPVEDADAGEEATQDDAE